MSMYGIPPGNGSQGFGGERWGRKSGGGLPAGGIQTRTPANRRRRPSVQKPAQGVITPHSSWRAGAFADSMLGNCADKKDVAFGDVAVVVATSQSSWRAGAFADFIRGNCADKKDVYFVEVAVVIATSHSSWRAGAFADSMRGNCAD